MSVDNTLNYYLNFRNEIRHVLSTKQNPEHINSFYFNFPLMRAYPKEALIFEIKDRDYSVDHRLDDLDDLYENAVLTVKIDNEKVPISVTVGPTPVVGEIGPNDNEKTVKLKGLPWECDEGEIRSFFEGLEILSNGIHILYNGPKIKRHSGDAFVEFRQKESVAKALEKNKQCIFGRYIEVQSTSKDEILKYKKKAYEVLQNENKSIPVDENSIVLKLLGLPWECTFSDVRNLFDDVPLTAIHFPKDKLGRPNGTAYVEVADEEFCARVLGHQREYVGKRFVDIKRSTMAELLIDMSFADDKEIMNSDDKTFCVLIRNLPQALNNFAIDSFFKQKSISPFRIHKKIDGAEAYCEFIRRNDYLKALDMNGSVIENNVISIQSISYDEVARKVGFINM